MKLMSMIRSSPARRRGVATRKQAMDYAKSPEGKRRIDGVRKQLAARPQAEACRPSWPANLDTIVSGLATMGARWTP